MTPPTVQSDTHILALIASRTDNAIAVTDEAGLIIWVNDGFTRMTGYALEDMLHQKPGHILQGPATNPETVRHMRDSFARQVPYSAEILNYRKDGQPYWVSMDVQPLTDTSGRITNWLSIQRDITAVREAERIQREHKQLLEQQVADRTAELECSRRQFQSLLELAPDAFIITDQDGFIRILNRQAELLFGWSRDEIIGQPVERLVPMPLRARHVVAREATHNVHDPFNQPHRGPLRALRKDGSEFPAEISLGKLDSDSGSMVTAVVRDISHRIQAEKTLRETEALYRNAIAAAGAVPYIRSHTGNCYTFIGTGILDLTGYPAAEMSPDLWHQISIRSVMRGEASGLSEVEAIERFRSGQLSNWRCDTLVRHRNGDLRWISESSVELKNDAGQVHGAIGILIDITERQQAEDDLRLFRTCAEHASYGVAIASLTGQIHYVNEAWAKAHGSTPAELVGVNLESFHHERDLPEVRKLVGGILQGESLDGVIVWHQRRDGTRFPSLMTASLVPDSQGRPAFMTATAIDVSDELLEHSRLRVRNEVLRHIAEGRDIDSVLRILCEQVDAVHGSGRSLVMKLDSNGQLNHLISANLATQQCRRLNRITPGPESGSCAAAAFHGGPIFVADTETDPVWNLQRPLARELGIKACWSIPIHDGTSPFGTFALAFPETHSANELDRGFIEECARLAGIAIQHHRVLQALREGEAHFRTLADSGQALIWTTDVHQQCDYVNQVWLRFTGRPLADELGEGWRTALHPEDVDTTLQASATAISLREPFTLSYRLRRHDGEYRWIEVFSTPRFNSRNEFIGYIGHCLDVTDRLAAQRQVNRSQRLEAIGQLAGGIAHDLNNALSPILMTSTLLRMDFPGCGEMADTIESSARRCADMVKHLLSFARGAEGKRQPLHPDEVLHAIDRIIRSTFPKNIELRLTTSPDAWRILGDPTQIHQILLNLCVNARDAMPTGGRITLRTENVVIDPTFAMTTPEAHPGNYLLLQVTDSGTGIAPEIIDRIFEPFFTTKDPEHGTGLGLSTVLGIVKGHGGFVRVTSQPGHGATFDVYIPALPVGSPASESNDSSKPASLTGDGRLILVVEDDANVRDVFCTILECLGFRVLSAADGAEGLIAVAESRASLKLVITDIQMPHLGGVQFTQALRRMLPTLPVIVASGRVDEADERQLRELGVSTILSKPFTQESLVGALAQALQTGTVADGSRLPAPRVGS